MGLQHSSAKPRAGMFQLGLWSESCHGPDPATCMQTCLLGVGVHTNSIIEEAGFPKMQRLLVLISVHTPPNVVRWLFCPM
jgi:hypothetical protein